ncbi:LysR family transcriptional regulator [Adlercreutzia sp. ZJ473]|uniref:LysR family transcriptional regulator n=1 Tax=Adlercreutzia sp. ZJ473 TaxID=2722822 RepID=UPI0015536053|nr:LysR family transcriptional regulator [Adlercreutzia sp. ZJ473]
MNLAQFEYLIALAETSSYAQAAKKLYISPQAISKSIADMERELGAKLVEKSGRGIAVTPLAVEVARLAESALQSVSEMRSLAKYQAEPRGTEDKLRLGVLATPYRGSPFGENAFNRFESRYPDVRLKVSFHSSEACLTALLEGVVDASIVMGRPFQSEIASSKIMSIRPVATMSTSRARSYAASVTFLDIAAAPLAMPYDLRCGYAILAGALQERGLTPKLVNVAPSLEAQQAFIVEGGMILCFRNTPLPSLIPETVAIPLSTSEEATWPIYLAHKKEQFSPAIASMLDHLRTAAKRNWLE